jgi:uncharacterized repeat protein (TIGR02059 family)
MATIGNLDTQLIFTSGDGPVAIDSDVTVTGGGNYADGYVRFALENPSSGDVLALPSGADVNAAGALSVDAGGNVFLGNGVDRDRVGTIDTVENGLAGKPLKILFSAPLPNSGFELGELNWQIRDEQYGNDGTEINFDGYAVPLATNSDSDSTYAGGTGEVKIQPNNTVVFNGQVQAGVGDGASSGLYLNSTGNISRTDADPQTAFKTSGYGSIHGPYAVSDVISVETGDSLSLAFKAVGSGDDYEVFGVLRRVDGNGDFIDNSLASGSNIVLFAERGADTGGFTTITKTSLPAGEYRFEFVGGTYDGSGGLAVGSNLYVDNIRLVPSQTITDTLVSSIAQQVTYNSTGEGGESVEATRELTIEASDGDGNNSSASTDLVIVEYNDAPSWSNPATDVDFGAVAEDATSPTGRTVADLFGTRFTDDDNNDALAGIAIAANSADAAKGEWQFSVDSGTTWASVGTVSNEAALLLDSNAQLRFIPATNYNGPATNLSVHAVDGSHALFTTDPAVGQNFDTTTDDATSAVSAAPVSLGATVTEGDDAPEGTITLTGIVATGETLTAHPTAITDVDGIVNGSLSYNWQRETGPGVWTDINGATSVTYTVASGDAGTSVRYVARYTDVAGNANEIRSEETSPVADAGGVGVAPVFDRATVNADHLTLRYIDEDALDTGSTPAVGQYTVKVNGVAVPVTNVVVSNTDNTVTLTLATAVGRGQAVTISYDPRNGSPVEDVAGNDAPELLAVQVINSTGGGGSGGTPTPPNSLIGEIENPQSTTSTDQDGNSVTVNKGKLGGADVVETIVERPDGQTSHSLSYSGSVSGAVSLPLLYENKAGSDNYTMVTLPSGVTLNSQGLRTPGDDDADLVQLIEETVGTSDQMRANMVEGAKNFLGSLNQSDTLWEHKVVLGTTAGSGPIDGPIVIDAAQDKSTGGFAEGLVIDASGLPKGTVLELQDVDFAVIRGDGIVVRGGAGENVVYGDAGSQNIVLTGSNDMIHGGGGDDTVGSTGSDSTLFGGAGNDQMMPGSGKNLLHGGDGEDFAVFAGALADYEVVRDNGITRVRSLATPGDEHMLVNVEAIQFGDQRLVVENDAPLGWIATLYEQVLGRQAELDGYQFWAASYDDGTPIGDIAMWMLYSSEYTENGSSVFQSLPQNAQIELLYEHLLSRDSEPEGNAYWTDRLAKGDTIASIAEQFILSSEWQGSRMAPDQWDFYL